MKEGGLAKTSACGMYYKQSLNSSFVRFFLLDLMFVGLAVIVVGYVRSILSRLIISPVLTETDLVVALFFF